MTNKRLILLTNVALVALISLPASAANPDGSIENRIDGLEKQIEMLRAELKAQKEKPAPKAATIDGIKISMKPSPKIESADGSFSFQPFGRIHTDAAFFDDDKVDHPDGVSIRRARIGFKGKVAEDFKYKIEMDFGKESLSFKDTYLAYSGGDAGTIKLGHFKPFLGLEELTSSNNVTFIERSSPISAFTAGRKIGLAYGVGDKDWSFNLGAFNDTVSVTSSDDEAWSLSSRATYAPVAKKGRVVHLGASANYRVPDASTDSARFRARAENNNASVRSVDTGTISSVDNVIAYGLEAAAVYDGLSLQGEYLAANTDIDGGGSADFDGYYAQASWLLTGESRPYKAKAGKFGSIKPTNPFNSKGGTGAWELALRYSNLDLNNSSAGITGGEMNNLTAGVNWYVNNYIRLMANYIMVDTDQSATTADDDPNIALLRAQLVF